MQIVKRILLVSLVGIFFLVFSGIIFTFIYGEKIENMIFEDIKKKMTSEVQLKDLEFSVFENFPYASVRLIDVLVMEPPPYNRDTLLYTQYLDLQVNMFDLLYEKQEIRNIVLRNSKLRIKYNEEGTPNFLIFNEHEENEEMSTPAFLSRIDFLNSTINFNDKQNNVDIDTEVKNLSIQFQQNQQSNFSLSGAVFMKNLLVGETDYIQKKNMKISGDLCYFNNSFKIDKSEIFIEDVKIKLGGTIENKLVNLNIEAQDQRIRSILIHMPEDYKSFCSNFKADGNLICKGIVQGTFSSESNPYLNMDFSISEGTFILKDKALRLDSIKMDGNINNGKAHNFESTVISVRECSVKTKKSTLHGMFSINDLNNHYLITEINSDIDFLEANSFFKNSRALNAKGKMQVLTKYSGRLSFSNDMKHHFLDAISHKSSIEFKDISFLDEPSSLLFGIKNMHCKIDNNQIIVDNSDITIADSDINFKGVILDFTHYLFDRNSRFDLTGEVQSVYIKYDELMQLNTKSDKRDSISSFPDWINFDLSTKVKKLTYKLFLIENLNAKLKYAERAVEVTNATMNTLNGEITGEAIFSESVFHDIKLHTKAHLQDINIRNLFTDFQNFGQDVIQDKHIKGEGTADIELEATWNPGFEFDKNKLKLQSDLVINKGELIGFSPLLSLSSYVSVEELKEVKFSTLENSISIQNNNINIPEMRIKSSALSLNISGSHTFRNEIDYRVKLLLSDLVFKKFKKRKRKRNVDTQFGIIRDDGLKATTLFLKMTGHLENPKISFDRIKIKEQIKTKVKKEKEELTEIIREDILNKKQDSSNTLNEKSPEIILEWEDE